MLMFSRLRQACRYRFYSTTLSPISSAPLSSRDKTRATITLLKNEENPERILDICRAATLTDTNLDKFALSLSISRLSESNYFEGIRQLLEELKTRPGLRNERFLSHAIALYGEANMLDHAIRSFEQMDELGIPRSAKSLEALILACVLAKNYKEVSRIYVEFPKIYGIEPNLYVYNLVIKAFCESGSSSSAYSILAEMDKKNVKPNDITFGNMFVGFYKEEKLEDVEKVLKLMEEYGIRPGVDMYNIRIKSLCTLNRSSDAKALVDGMISRGIEPNSVTYRRLIHGFCLEGNLEEANKLFTDIKGRGRKPDVECYFDLIHFLCLRGDFEAALDICRESMKQDWFPNFETMRILVKGLASISKVDDARRLIKKIKKKFKSNTTRWNEIEAGLPQ
ncbi:hypothetical protein L6164_032200 [Bauhinia variegata]|uniref:Uncharacterized protein n=1 Tax=Bauhinia variegata TaxID=167791 RepID=A0ACB9KN05_BAUVA|nr:hypothetical protein L6164_032200 [Bauhinia variegata]